MNVKWVIRPYALRDDNIQMDRMLVQELKRTRLAKHNFHYEKVGPPLLLLMSHLLCNNVSVSIDR